VQYRRLGRTGLQVSAIGFGCIKFNSVTQDEVTRALNLALDLGLNFVDTARNYGTSEQKIGRALRKRRAEFILATKTEALTAREASRDLRTSLRELQTDTIDLYQLHSVSDPQRYEAVMAPGGALEALKKAQQEGKIRHIGITQHRAIPQMKAAIESGEFETIMVAFSPLDQEGVGAEVIPLAVKHDMGVIAMKALSGGQLASLPDPRSGQPPRPDPIVAGALRHVLAKEGVSTVIPGMVSVAQVEENLPLADMPPLSDGQREDLVRRIAALRRSFRYGQVCLRCGYCQPCPEGVPIPQILQAHDMLRQYPEPLKHLGRELYASLGIGADACVECRQCEDKCPAGLTIPERLKEAIAALRA
jgi:predicted aldo/keto reductase-like oxidoreductase